MLGLRARFAGCGCERSWWLLLAAVLWAIAQMLGSPGGTGRAGCSGGGDHPRVAGLVRA